jgi:hypothetical protein
VRQIGVRGGNWLTADQAEHLLADVDRKSLCGKRNYAILANVGRSGLRRRELLALRVDAIGAARGALGYCGLDGEGGTYPDGASSSVGKGGDRRLDAGEWRRKVRSFE